MLRVNGLLLAVGLTFALSGCAEEWVRPGGTPQQFQAEEAQCLNEAYRRYPPAEVRELASEAYYRPIETKCDSNGKNCTHRGGEYVPASYRVRDLNGGPRNADVRACLFRRGWTPKP